MRVPWTARRPDYSIVKEMSPECSLEGLMLKLKLPSFGHLEKTLRLGKSEGRRRRGRQRRGRLDGVTDSMDTSLRKLGLVHREAWRVQATGSQRVRHACAAELNTLSARRAIPASFSGDPLPYLLTPPQLCGTGPSELSRGCVQG